MKYVLIFLVITEVFGSYSVTAEFDDKAACDAALTGLRNTQLGSFNGSPHNSYLHGECYPKASK